jgi:hypothetical protein
VLRALEILHDRIDPPPRDASENNRSKGCQ